MITGLSRVNASEDSKPIDISRTRRATLTLLRVGRNYLENGYARIFGELPLQFSNEAPALIWK